MKKRRIIVLLVICLSLCACGRKTALMEETAKEVQMQESDEAEAEESEGAEPEKEWQYNQIELPDANEVLEDIVPDDCKVSGEIWGLANETVYRFFDIVKPAEDVMGTDETLGYCVQMLMPPYTEWKNYPIALKDWLEGKSCNIWNWSWARCISEEGAVYVLLTGDDGEYVGRWSRNGGCSATKLENDWLTRDLFEGAFVNKWSASDEWGLYFSYSDTEFTNYRTLWVDEKGHEKTGLPGIEQGYVWQVSVNPYSGETYMYGTDAGSVESGLGSMQIHDTGFSIWSQESEAAVFMTMDTGMFWTDTVAFYSETEGFLCNANGVWKFALEDQSLENLLSGGIGGNSTAGWHGFCARGDGSLVLLSSGVPSADGECTYFLWELSKQEVSNQE